MPIISNDHHAIIPANVRVLFPAQSPVSNLPPYAVTVQLSQLGLGSQIDSAYSPNSGTMPIQSIQVANYDTKGNLTNKADLDALAKQLATDYYLFELGKLDVVFPGIAPWKPEGTSDSIRWFHKGIGGDDGAMVSTRVQRGSCHAYLDPQGGSSSSNTPPFNLTFAESENGTIENLAKGINTLYFDVGEDGNLGTFRRVPDDGISPVGIYRPWDLNVQGEPKITQLEFKVVATNLKASYGVSYDLKNDEKGKNNRATVTLFLDDVDPPIGPGSGILTVTDDFNPATDTVNLVDTITAEYPLRSEQKALGNAGIFIADYSYISRGTTNRVYQESNGVKRYYHNGLDSYLELDGNAGISTTVQIRMGATGATGDPANPAAYKAIGYLEYMTGFGVDPKIGVRLASILGKNTYLYAESGPDRTITPAFNVDPQNDNGVGPRDVPGQPPSAQIGVIHMNEPIRMDWKYGDELGQSYRNTAVPQGPDDQSGAGGFYDGARNHAHDQRFSGGVYIDGGWHMAPEPGYCSLAVLGQTQTMWRSRTIDWLVLNAGTIPYAPTTGPGSSPSAAVKDFFGVQGDPCNQGNINVGAALDRLAQAVIDIQSALVNAGIL